MPTKSDLVGVLLNAIRRSGPGRAGPGRPFTFGYQNVLGTNLEMTVVAGDEDAAERARDAALAEIDRLESIFSRFDEGSELNRWLRGDQPRSGGAGRGAGGPQDVSEELAWLLEESERWVHLTGGAFHPGADALAQLWRKAEATGTPPSQAAIDRVLEPFGRPLWALDRSALRAEKRFPFDVNFNAIAKGRIVDLAVRAAVDAGGVDVVLDIGGDIRQVGARAQRVGVADPRHPAFNAPPATVVTLQDEAIATSGGSYRGFRVAGAWRSHVLDPRTGRPVTDMLAATVIAPDCSTADVLATAFSVLRPDESLALADDLPAVGCLLHAASGEVHSNAEFDRHAVV